MYPGVLAVSVEWCPAIYLPLQGQDHPEGAPKAETGQAEESDEEKRQDGGEARAKSPWYELQNELIYPKVFEHHGRMVELMGEAPAYAGRSI